MRRRFKSALATLCLRTGAARLVGAASGAASSPLVVGYHRVVDEFGAHESRTMPPMLVGARMLEAHVDWIARRYRVLSLDDMGRALAESRPAGRLAAITFDDGYRDVYENAFPILRRKGIPAAVFVVTDLVGTRAPQLHDRLHHALTGAAAAWSRRPGELAAFLSEQRFDVPGVAAEPFDAVRAVRLVSDALPQGELERLVGALRAGAGLAEPDDPGLLPLDWPMLVEMRRAGFTVGSHGRSHALLTNETEPTRRDETRGSRRTLEDRLGAPIEHFAYPAGRFDPAAVASVAAAGYRFAYTTCSHQDPLRPLLTIPRRLLWERSCLDARGGFSPAVMRCLASGLFDVVSGCRDPHRLPPPAAHGRLVSRWTPSSSRRSY